MADIELFHYYRQDVLGIRINGERFCEIKGEQMIVHLEEALEHVRKVRERCRKKNHMIEEAVLVCEERGELKKTYRVCIYGKGGQVGMLLNLKVPSRQGFRHVPRAGPIQRQRSRQDFLNERKIF